MICITQMSSSKGVDSEVLTYEDMECFGLRICLHWIGIPGPEVGSHSLPTQLASNFDVLFGKDNVR